MRTCSDVRSLHPLRKFSPLGILLFLLGVALPQPAYAAGPIDDPNDVEWVSLRDLSNARFSGEFTRLKALGYRMIDVDYSGGKYSMVWRKSDGRKWAEYRDMTSSRYHRRWTEFKKKGYRPLDVDAYRRRGRLRWSGIWVQNVENLKWASFRNLSSTEFSKKFDEYKAKYIPIDVETYTVGGKRKYAVIWIENKPRVPWAEFRGMTSAEFGSKWQKFKDKGYRLLDFESYRSGRTQRYIGVWVKNSNGRAWASRRDMGRTTYANEWRTYRDRGYRLIDFERYKTKRGWRYAGIWRQNGDIANWRRRNAVDGVVAAYKSKNNLPGLSVVIIKDRKMVYRRGFGQADVARNRVAHSKTVYNAASVSKVIGATLMFRMRDRTPSLFNLSALTRSYIPGMPTKHSHRIRDLLTHTGCVHHYTNGVGKVSSIPAKQYKTQTAAAKRFWADSLICTPPSTANNYSTHAFTFLGAVLEETTGQTLSKLIRNELAVPFGLDSLRVQDLMVSDYDRAQPYKLRNTSKDPHPKTNKNKKTGHANSSWKIFGGGIEMSAYDLARFGEAVRRNRVVKKTTKDDMWTKKVGNYGWAWLVNNSKKYAHHNGSWSGARSYLRVYKKKNLVIAIMSNRRNHTKGGDISGLADSIASAL